MIDPQKAIKRQAIGMAEKIRNNPEVINYLQDYLVVQLACAYDRGIRYSESQKETIK